MLAKRTVELITHCDGCVNKGYCNTNPDQAPCNLPNASLADISKMAEAYATTAESPEITEAAIKRISQFATTDTPVIKRIGEILRNTVQELYQLAQSIESKDLAIIVLAVARSTSAQLLGITAAHTMERANILIAELETRNQQVTEILHNLASDHTKVINQPTTPPNGCTE